MRALVLISFLCAIQVDTQSNSKFSDFSQQFWANLFRQGKTVGDRGDLIFTTPALTTSLFTKSPKSTKIPSEFTSKMSFTTTTTGVPIEFSTMDTVINNNKTVSGQTTTISTHSITALPTAFTELIVDPKNNTSAITSTTASTSTVNDMSTGSTLFDTTTSDYIGTTGEPREIPNSHDFYLINREKPFIKISSNISQNLLPLPAGAGAALVKPTKYHYYPHNQHIYLLPECAIQQVCNAVYVRLNWTQPLCACPSRYRDPCSASLNSDDLHTTELSINRRSKKALTLVKTCEPTNEMRICRAPRDWSLLALQNIRTGKSHYLVICRCPQNSVLEGPMSHDQPTYASVPGIRVYGMMCVDNKHRPLRTSRTMQQPSPPFPWKKVKELVQAAIWA